MVEEGERENAGLLGEFFTSLPVLCVRVQRQVP